MTLPGQKISQLRALLRQLDSVLVCFSGGVDSGYLLAEAVAELGEGAIAFTAVSPSLAPEEKTEAERLAKGLGARHILVETHELDDARYTSNPSNRCYFCKTEVYGVAVEKALELGIEHVIDGFNVDDRADHRPGRRASREKGVRSPLDEAGFSKAEIREAARAIGLPVWDKPALACLASRFPYGSQITPERLEQVAQCERILRTLGFRLCRVRHHGAVARIELSRQELAQAFSPAVKNEILKGFKEAGFSYVTVDLEGYRTGSMNVNTDSTMQILANGGRDED